VDAGETPSSPAAALPDTRKTPADHSLPPRAIGNAANKHHAGYDRAGNRLYREDPVAASFGKAFDELYLYDGSYRLRDMKRGTLNAGKTAITGGTPTFGQCWTLDTTGNWRGFREDSNGDSTWDLVQSRSANPVNEITGITNTTGPAWANPAYNAVGNMTTIPQPADPTKSYTATYNAWNMLTKLVDASNGQAVQENAYDALRRRAVRKEFTAGVLSETRHFYYTAAWQIVEERLGTTPDSANPNRQFVWGLRYIDDLLLRDRDTDGNGSLDERLYGMQDPNWNVIAIANSGGDVQERYAVSAYGLSVFLSPAFSTRTSTLFESETLYVGYRFDAHSQLFIVRNRFYSHSLGWLQRDPVMTRNLYSYALGRPYRFVDPRGLAVITDSGTGHISSSVDTDNCTVTLVVKLCLKYSDDGFWTPGRRQRWEDRFEALVEEAWRSDHIVLTSSPSGCSPCRAGFRPNLQLSIYHDPCPQEAFKISVGSSDRQSSIGNESGTLDWYDIWESCMHIYREDDGTITIEYPLGGEWTVVPIGPLESGHPAIPEGTLPARPGDSTTYCQATVVHEMGHVIGVSHPGVGRGLRIGRNLLDPNDWLAYLVDAQGLMGFGMNIRASYFNPWASALSRVFHCCVDWSATSS
ncbi:MAG: RHS repeat domain-containing protein, partial [Planctomycetales bacterium]